MKLGRFFLLIIPFFVVSAAFAQTGGEEVPGGLVTDETPPTAITANTPLTIHVATDAPAVIIYEAADAETVTISARSLEQGNALDPILSISSNDAILAVNDDHGTSRNDLKMRDALIPGLELPGAGRYFIEVSAYFDGANRVEGDVEVLLTAATAPTNGDQRSQTISDAVPESGAFTYNLAANAGDVVTITVRATNNLLDPKLTLTDSSGAVIAENDDHERPDDTLRWSDSQILDLTIPAADTYTITVTGFRGVGGTFELTINFSDADTPGAQPTTPPLAQSTPIAPEQAQVIDASITPRESYSYMLDAEAGDVYTITASATAAGLDPLLVVYFNDRYLTDNDDFGSNDRSLNPGDARIYNLIIAETGRYEVLVAGYSDTAGSFRLTIEQVATGAPLGVPSSTVELGTLAAGDVYTTTFNAQAGDYVTITARSVEGDFDPYIALLSASGTVLLDNDDNGTSQSTLAFLDAQISNYRITESGVYTVEVSSLVRSSGSFALTISTLR